MESKLPKEKIRALIIEYYQLHGFKLASQDDSQLVFKQGSTLRNMATFNPLKWKSETIIQFVRSDVTISSEISTSFQVVTAQEESVWQSFIASLQELILTGDLDPNANKESIEANKSSTKGYLGYAVLGSLLLGIPSGFAAHLTDMDSLVYIGASCGAMSFLFWKINMENQK